MDWREDDYLDKAIQAADQLSHIRQSRNQLRIVISSPLYDVSSLNSELWNTFETMSHRSVAHWRRNLPIMFDTTLQEIEIVLCYS